jgi:hypothetical protein
MCGEHQIVRKRGRERLAAVVVDELFRQSTTEPLRQAADELAFDQLGIDRTPDVVGDGVALDIDASGVAIDGDHRDMHAVRVSHVRGGEVAFDHQAAIEALRQFAKRD